MPHNINFSLFLSSLSLFSLLAFASTSRPEWKIFRKKKVFRRDYCSFIYKHSAWNRKSQHSFSGLSVCCRESESELVWGDAADDDGEPERRLVWIFCKQFTIFTDNISATFSSPSRNAQLFLPSLTMFLIGREKSQIFTVCDFFFQLTSTLAVRKSLDSNEKERKKLTTRARSSAWLRELKISWKLCHTFMYVLITQPAFTDFGDLPCAQTLDFRLFFSLEGKLRLSSVLNLGRANPPTDPTDENVLIT